MPEAHPLAWPVGWPRTTVPQRSRFGDGEGQTLSWARDELDRQLRLLGATDVVLSLNRGARRGDDQGAAVYFKLDGAPYCLPSDKWDRQGDNVWAIAKHIDALRGQQRWGVGSIARAFAGYRALTGVGERKPWFEVLGFRADSLPTIEELEKKVRELRLQHHPDRGGHGDQMAEINAAYTEGRKALGF